MNFPLFGVPSKRTAAWDQCFSWLQFCWNPGGSGRNSPYYLIPHVLWVEWLHFATSPFPGRSSFLPGVPAQGMLLPAGIWGKQIKGIWKWRECTGWWLNVGVDMEAANKPNKTFEKLLWQFFMSILGIFFFNQKVGISGRNIPCLLKTATLLKSKYLL